jgi:hypothetical protein
VRRTQEVAKGVSCNQSWSCIWASFKHEQLLGLVMPIKDLVEGLKSILAP